MPANASTKMQGAAAPNRGKKQITDSPKTSANRKQQRQRGVSAARRQQQWMGDDGTINTEARQEKVVAEEVEHVIPQQRMPDANAWHRKLHDACPVPESEDEEDVK
jgi:hypothetical protein